MTKQRQSGERAGVINQHQSQRLRALLLAASVGAIAVATPLPVLAQSLPSGCTDAITNGTPNDADGAIDDGETITCLAPPTPIAPISTTANDLTIVVGDTNTPTTVSGGTTGIQIGANGGASVRVNNAASSVSGSIYGIRVDAGRSRLGTDDLNIDVAGTVVGGTFGVAASNQSAGNTTINVADVTGTSSVGVLATHLFNAGDLSVTTTGNVVGGRLGISVFNSGSGNTYVRSGAALGTPDTSTTITGTSQDGVSAITGVRSGSLTLATYSNIVSTGVYNAAYGVTLAQRTADGIDADHDGSGALTIGTGNVSSTYGLGIRADVSSVGTNLSITSTGTVSGGTGGISAVNNGTGAVTVNAVDVSASGADEEAIYAFGAGTTTGMNITATGTVSATGAETAATGSPDGIFANHDGSNALMINTAAVSSTNGVGIRANNSSAGTNLSVTSTGLVTGTSGLFISNYGSGSTTISTGAVTGTSGSGIYGRTDGQNLKITSTGLVQGTTAINALNYGSGYTTISTAAVTGGIDALSASSTTNLSITSTGEITGSNGVKADLYGTGTLSINVAGVSASGPDSYGILAISGSNTTGSNITANGNVSSTGADTTDEDNAPDAIYGNHNGSGSLQIDTYGTVSSTNGNGIVATVASPGQNLSITATNTVTAGLSGIDARNNGTGTVTVNAAAVSASGADEEAIYAFGAGTTTGMNITATGTVSSTGAETGATGSPNGIFANHDGSNALTINTAAVSSTNAMGIRADVSSAGTNLSITSTGTVSGGTGGIEAKNNGTGTTTLNVADVTSTGDDTPAIYAYGAATTTGMSITSTGTVMGVSGGINARNNGTGTVTINAVDVSASGADEEAIYAFGASTTTGMNITATGTVSSTGAETGATGSPDGIFANHDGSNALTINTAAVSSTNARGIYANVSSAGTNLSITSTDTVSGSLVGILSRNFGSGDLTLNTAAVTGTGSPSYGIIASNGTNGQNVSITSTGTVSGANTGLNLSQSGSGTTMISVADVSGNTGNGIFANNSSSAADLTIASTGTVTGNIIGIYGDHDGRGALTINANNVTSANGQGINAITSRLSSDLSVTSTRTVSGRTGIYASSNGTGTTTLNVADVTGTVGAAIYARGASTTTGMSITSTGTVMGVTRGINAFNLGTGTTTLNVAAVSASSGTGIYASGTSTTTGMSITSTGLVSGNNGVSASHSGSGALTVNTAAVNGTSGVGISVRAGASSTSLGITSTGTVTGSTNGIFAVNSGTGNTTLNVAGVTGSGGYGIYAYGASSSTAMSITSTSSVMGSTHGIYADHRGSGDLIVNSQAVTGSGQRGISADLFTAGANLTVNAQGNVIGQAIGLYANSNGTGAVTVTSTDVTGQTGRGIYARGASTTTNLNVTSTGTVTGTTEAIRAYHEGTGTATVNVNNVTSSGGDGISVATLSTSQDVMITSTGNVSGTTNGIYADQNGVGALIINTAAVTGTNGYGSYGIYADVGTGGTNLSITSTGLVSGSADAINARNSGSGQLSINVADATAAYNFAINAGSTSTTTDMTIRSSGTLTGNNGAITANHQGTGSLTINANNLSSYMGGGVLATVGSAGQNLSVTTTGSINGQLGVLTSNSGTGTTTINVANVTGGSGDGINSYGSATAGAISITGTGSITGTDGIQVSTSSGASLVLSGAVTGTSGYGINFTSSPSTSVTLNSGASVSGSSGAFSFAAASTDTLTVNSGASINGAVSLGDQGDVFNDAGGTFATVDGGLGTDTWNISGSGRTINASSASNFELLTVGMSGGRLIGNFTGFSSAIFTSGSNTLAGSLGATSTTINAGASVSTENAASFGGALVNNGTLNVIGRVNTGSFTQSSTGTLTINPNQPSVNELVSSGPVTLGGTLNAIFDLQPGIPSSGTQTVRIIDGSGGVSGNFDTVNLGASGLLFTRSVEIDQANSDVNVAVTVNPITTLTTLNQDQLAVGGTLLGLLADPNLDQTVVQFINDLGVQTTESAIASVLNELNPEGFDAGLRLSTYSQQNLFASMMNAHRPPGEENDIRLASLNPVPAIGTPDDGPVWWTSTSFANIEQANTRDDFGFEGTEFGFTAGVSGIGIGAVSLGFAGGYSTFEGDTLDQLSDDVDADLYQVAASAHYSVETNFMNGQLEGALGFATGDNTLAMTVVNPGTAGQSRQTGDTQMQSISLLTRFTLFGTGESEWPVKPRLELGATNLNQGETSIGGGGVTNLIVDEVDTSFAEVGLGVSFGFPINENLSWAGSMGATQFFGDTENLYRSRFVDAFSRPSSFATEGASLEQQFDVEAGLAYTFWGDAELSVNGFGQFGDLESYGARLSLTKMF